VLTMVPPARRGPTVPRAPGWGRNAPGLFIRGTGGIRRKAGEGEPGYGRQAAVRARTGEVLVGLGVFRRWIRLSMLHFRTSSWTAPV
jgi:hypothetical protein